ncbi:amylo-alpha-1,6-glucosidase [Methylocaldum sp.]|uniref:amylo-alpha-1,6-glucosidase n=1 Tax=Methylocaldum sp. TaxID=1969727 RepID=UPI002D2F4BD5|nr:amylo-alpha-1,6-glucosidase [Methylocaldum sp.]HYE36418.1 amylo-alpha-1,6-glucosidase [Methylocaldum sp.]
MNVMTRPDFIRFGREICGNLIEAERREWWLADGLGGYAAGTVAGTLTRRYHGLLVAPLAPPLGRSLVFAKADAWLDLDGHIWPLCSNRWPGEIIDPAGHIHIESFRLDGRMPEWIYAFGDLRLTIRVWLEPGASTVYLAYRADWPKAQARDLALRIKLLANARDHHGNAEPRRFNPVIEPDGADGLIVRNPPGSGSAPYRLCFKARGGVIRPGYTWYDNFDLPLERARELPDWDHHLCVGECRLPLVNGEWSGLTASLHSDASPYVEEAMRRCQAHDDGVLARAELRDAPDWIRQLALAADSFLFARPLPDRSDGVSVIAGYPWFGDWGRDTMIALPGLTLATGRYDDARRILQTFARFIDRGMLPNVFPEDRIAPEYNTVDAALWYIEAWRAYVDTTGDLAALRAAFPALQEVVASYREGTRYGIGLDEGDGLIRAGEPGMQLTWMDAKVGDWVVTPRIGKPVEINALWYNALRAMADFAGRLNLPGDEYETLAERARTGFQRFINPSGGLLDVLDGPGGDDSSVRPNQILAVSLPHSPLVSGEQVAVLTACGATLLTSYGLRSLAPEHSDYRSQYRGGVRERDGAYHQGTAWTWLLGHCALAEFRVSGDAGRALSRLEPIRDHLLDAGLGTVSEIFDADPPHAPQGCPAQAWSVAAVLEAWWRISKSKRPDDRIRRERP